MPMTQHRRAIALLLAAIMLILGAVAHAATGATLVLQALGASPADPAAADALRAGWQLGSVALAAFGLLVLAAGVARWRGEPVGEASLWVVAAALVGFGAGAVVLGNQAYVYLYLGYLVIGALVAYGALPQGGVGARGRVLRVAPDAGE